MSPFLSGNKNLVTGTDKVWWNKHTNPLSGLIGDLSNIEGRFKRSRLIDWKKSLTIKNNMIAFRISRAILAGFLVR